MNKLDRDIISIQLWHFACDLAVKHYDEEKLRAKYTELIALALEHDCCDLYTVDDMVEMINRGCINRYDGIGFWLDKDFNRIGYIFGITDTVPSDAVWADWYNK